MNIFYPVKNSSGKKNFPSFFKLFVTLLLCLAGVQGLFAQDWYIVGDEFGWDTNENYKFTSIGDNKYLLDVDMTEEKPNGAAFNIQNSNNEKFGLYTPSLDYCNGGFWLYKNDGSRATWKHNSGKYRLTLDVTNNSGDNPSVSLRVTGIIVTIDQPVKNADGTYTITGRFTNANTIGQQEPTPYQIVIKYGTTTDNENATLSGDGSFSITKSFTPGVTYTCFARVIDNKIGNNDSESITFVAGQGPTDLNLYVRGQNYNNWGYPGEDFKGVTTDGVTYTWDWISAPKKMSGPFKIAYCNINKPENWNNDLNFGLSTAADLTLGENGVWQGVLVATDGGDMTIDAANPWTVSMITFNYDTKKLVITTTQEQTPEIVDLWLRGEVDNWNNPPSDDWKASTADGVGYSWSFENPKNLYGSFKIATWDAETEDSWNDNYDFGGTYPDNSTVLARNAATGVATLTLVPKTPGVDNSNGNLILNETWQVTSMYFNMNTLELVINTVVDQPVYPITPTAESFVVTWAEPVYDAEAGTVVLSATVAAAENAGFTLDQASGLHAQINVQDGASSGLVSLPNGDGQYVVSHTVTGVQAGSTVNYSLQIVTGEGSEIVSSSNVPGINPQDYQVQCQTCKPGFTISGQFNEGVTDGDGLYQGKAVESGEADPANGYWSDGARFIQLTANNVPADLFEWQCVGYKIDDNTDNTDETENIPTIAWTGQDETSARAELSLPGTYTFVCKATCNGVEATSDSLTITAPAPEMGFDGPAFVGSSWNHASAGREGEGLMTRQNGTLTWKSRVLNVANFGEEFVVIQRYKTLGCNDFSEKSSDESSRGWTGNGECGDMELTRSDNKVNRAETLQFMNVEQPGDDANFKIANGGNWTAGEGGTQLQLVVTMNGTDSYTVALEEVSQECTTPADNFPISARLNQGAGEPFEGNLVASGSNTKTGGYFADDFRTVTLTTTQVADTYEWKLVGYAIDGNAQATADLTTLATITNGEAQTATALLSRPGDYTFQCTAACTDGTPVNSATVTISTYPEMGFDGPIGTPASVSENGWNHAWAAEENNGLLERQSGTLTWTNTFTYQNVNNLTDFVVIQRYKLGCVATPKGYEDRPAYLGWAGHDECPGQSIVNSGNKINASANISFQGYAVSSNPGEQNMNFIASGEKVSSWISGETQLTLTVTMTGYDSYTVELTKKIYANYSSNDETKGTVTMKVGDTTIDNGDDITAYIGQQVTLTATPAQGYKVASWKINGKVTESDRTTIKPKLSGDGLKVVVTFERDCYAGVAYDLTGGGVICAKGGSTELSLNTLNDVTYQLYKDGAKCGAPVQGKGEAAKWTISEEGTYTAKAYDSRYEECKEQAMDMNKSAVVTSVEAPEISVNPGANVHLTVLQARSFTADVPVDWSITEVTGSGDYCKGVGYMISSQTDTSLVAKFLCVGTAKITATMKAHNQNCKAEVTVTQNAAETEVCAPEPGDGQ